jgi:hypothetical protein
MSARTTLPPRGNGDLLLQRCRRRQPPYLYISLLIPFELVTSRHATPREAVAGPCAKLPLGCERLLASILTAAPQLLSISPGHTHPSMSSSIPSSAVARGPTEVTVAHLRPQQRTESAPAVDTGTVGTRTCSRRPWWRHTLRNSPQVRSLELAGWVDPGEQL